MDEWFSQNVVLTTANLQKQYENKIFNFNDKKTLAKNKNCHFH